MAYELRMIKNFLEQIELRGRDIAIRSATTDDRALLTRWFNDPDVYAHWGGKPLSSEEIEAHCIVQVTDDICRPFIIMHMEYPCGFIQAWLRNDMTGGLDLFVQPKNRRQSIGRRALSLLAAYLREIEGWKRITVDPRVDNTVAIAAFESAGFRDTGERFTEDNVVHMLMEYECKRR
jgi:RimJ/RimL family protein N-acetyltransferase